MFGRSIAALFLASFSSPWVSASVAQTPASAAEAGDASTAAATWLAARRHAGLELPRDLLVAREGAPAPRVVAVGRALHGTAEIGRFELATWNAASALEGFDVLAVDIGLAEGFAADAWIRTGQGDLDGIVNSIGAWGWSHEESRRVLEALRQRNSDKAAKPVTIVGIGVGAPNTLCDPFAAFLRKVYPESAPRVEVVMQALATNSADGRQRYGRLDDNDRAILQYGLDEALSMTREHEEDYSKRSSPAEYAQALARITALVQYEQTMRFELTGGEHDPHGRILAENVATILSRAPATTRVLVLANMRDLARASDPDSFAAQIEALAQVRPVCIATAVGSAEFSAIDPNSHAPGPLVPRVLTLEAAKATELEALLAKSGAGDAVFDLRASSSAAPAWLAKSRTLRSSRASCGGQLETPWDFSVARDFDALVWFGEVHASKPAAIK